MTQNIFDTIGALPEGVLAVIPWLVIIISVICAIITFPIGSSNNRTLSIINLTAAALKVVLIAVLVPAVVLTGVRPEFSFMFLPGVEFVLRVDPLALFFAGLSAVLWLLTTIYALGYLGNKPHQGRFFGFFSLCVATTVGISFAGNLITFLVFYELLTLVTYPLVAHWGDKKSLKAASKYLRYTLSGGLILLIGVVALTVAAGPVDFAEGGADAVAELAAQSPTLAVVIFGLLIAGLGVKSALVPLHGWLPAAMAAPAPVSALLHAVAVVKAGVFGIVRVIDDVYGVQLSHELGVLTPLAILASVTIIYGSIQALRQTEIKARLAYSTVSQVSYVILGISMFSAVGSAGGVVHLVHQGIMKITLFFCAGLYAQRLGAHQIRELDGAGPKMPWTSVAFSIAAMGMIGLPPTAGFVSKWQLGLGALESPHPWILGVLLISSALNAAYFLPIVYRIWWGQPTETGNETADSSGQSHVTSAADDDAGDNSVDTATQRITEPASMLLPALSTGALTVILAIIASVTFAPLAIAEFIADGVFN